MNIILKQIEYSVYANYILSIMFIIILNIYIIKKFNYLSDILIDMKEISKGNYRKKIPIKGNGSFSELANGVNRISDLNKECIVNSVKSDIVCIRLIKELSKEYSLDINKYNNKIERLKLDLNLKTEEIDVVKFIESQLNIYKLYIDEKGLTIKWDLDTEAKVIVVDRELLKVIIDEIINNIIKHSMSQTNIYIKVLTNNDKLSVCFKNICEKDIRIKDIRAIENTGIRLIENIAFIQDIYMDIDIEASLFKITCIF